VRARPCREGARRRHGELRRGEARSGELEQGGEEEEGAVEGAHLAGPMRGEMAARFWERRRLGSPGWAGKWRRGGGARELPAALLLGEEEGAAREENGEGEVAGGSRVVLRRRQVTGAPVAAGRGRAPRGARALPQGSGEDDDRWVPGGPTGPRVAVFPFYF